MRHAIESLFCLVNGLVPRCGLHHLFEHHGGHGAAPDPQAEAFGATVLIIFASALVVLLFCCPFLALRVRRIRDLFWIIPSLDLALYLASIALRPYPEGFGARFQTPGVWYTFAEVFLVLTLSLVIASANACVLWLMRLFRRRTDRSNDPPNAGPNASFPRPAA